MSQLGINLALQRCNIIYFLAWALSVTAIFQQFPQENLWTATILLLMVSQQSGQKSSFGLGFEVHATLFDSYPFTWKTPPHRKVRGLKKFVYVLIFLPETVVFWRAPQGRNQLGEIGFLQRSVGSCNFLRRSAVSWKFLQKSAPTKPFDFQSESRISKNLLQSANICENGPIPPFWFLPLREPLGKGRKTVSRALLRRREITEFCGKLGEFCETLGEFALSH